MKNLLLQFVLILCVASILSCSDKKSRFEGENAIAFMSDRDGHSEIYVMMPDGKHQKRLTESPIAYFMPAWAPDRNKIAFVSVGEGETSIFTITLQEGKVAKIASIQEMQGIYGIHCLSWSPDGKNIAFETDARNGGRKICVIDIDDKTILSLRNNASDPSYSPDGKKMAFKSPASPNGDIYVMTIATDSVIKVTSTLTERKPAWSPDGRKIAFTSRRSGNSDIWIMDYDGKNQKQLTFDPGDDFDPSWSPNGQQIAFTSSRHSSYPPPLPSSISYLRRNFEIYVINTDGSSETQLTHQPGVDAQPSWSY